MLPQFSRLSAAATRWTAGAAGSRRARPSSLAQYRADRRTAGEDERNRYDPGDGSRSEGAGDGRCGDRREREGKAHANAHAPGRHPGDHYASHQRRGEGHAEHPRVPPPAQSRQRARDERGQCEEDRDSASHEVRRASPYVEIRWPSNAKAKLQANSIRRAKRAFSKSLDNFSDRYAAGACSSMWQIAADV